MKILLTGAAGFAGSHLTEELLLNPAVELISIDRLTYAGRLDRLEHLDQSRIKYIHHDIAAELPQWMLDSIGQVDYIIHNGAATHVKRAFTESEIFLRSNCIGTFNMLEAARKLKPKKFIYISTDEVFGPAKDTPFKADDPLAPTNPYSATKAAGEMLAWGHYKSFGIPLIITRTGNMFGPRQHVEKFVPLAIKKILNNEVVPIFGEWDKNPFPEHVESFKMGVREWLHVRNQANAIAFLLEHGQIGEKYQIAGEKYTTLMVALMLADALEKDLKWEAVKSDRPFHDIEYSIDGSKILNLGWKPPKDFDEALCETASWTAANPKWLEE